MRLRFSLRTFLIAIAITGAAFGGAAAWRQSIVDRAERHVRALAALEMTSANPAIRGKDKYPDYVRFVRKWIHPRAFEVKDRVCAPRDYWTTPHMAQLKNLYGLEMVTCSFDRFTIEDAKALAAISDLRQLNLSMKEFDSAALSEIAAIPSLESLSIHGHVDESFFATLRGHARISKLMLGDEPISSKDALAIASLRQLASLDSLSRETDGSVLQILAKSNVETLLLGLKQCSLSDLQWLEKSQIKELVLWRRQFDAGTLAAASRIPNLERLELYGNLEIGDGDFEALKACKQLQGIRLPSTWITAEQWDILAALPKLKVVCARETEGSQEAIRRFRDSMPGRNFETP